MKARIIFAVAALAGLWAVQGAVAADDGFRAGAAKTNITPPLGLPLVGEWNNPLGSYVRHELFARCLVFDNGKTHVAFVVCDLLGVSRALSDEARRLAEEQTGIPASHILVSATHTHSASSAMGNNRLELNEPLDDYSRFVARRVADAVACAVYTLRPARIGWTSAQEPRHVFCRRWFMKPGTVPKNPFGSKDDLVKMNPGRQNPGLDKPAGPVDPEIFILAAQTPEGQPIGMLANYSLHYVGGTVRGEITADYYGLYNDRIQELLGVDRQEPPFVSIMSNGTSGNINNIDFSQPAEKLPPYGKMRIVAEDVAQAVFAAYQKIEWREQIEIGASFEEITLAMRRPTPEHLEMAKGILAKMEPGKKATSLPEIYAERALMCSSFPPEWKFPMQAFRVGDVGITAIPCEVFSETGLDIKANSPLKPAFTVSLAHGYFGYLPTPEQHKLGGYETWLGTSRLEVEAEPKIRQALLGMLERLRSVSE
ncbi:MAG: hypothetical protein PHU80_07220 [Kiritimatiellae bacterium]|nr:hypothetical protein [Kiritimatiellia bacterium]